MCDQRIARGPTATIDPDLQLHLHQAQAAMDAFKADKAAASHPDSPTVLTMDLQQTLPTPHIPTSEVFYLRQLWTYNFAVHLCDDHSAAMCVWPEHRASRGADEIASCLLKALPTLVKNKRKIIVWSDSCSGQNKNFRMMCFWNYIVQIGMFDDVKHKFFVPGHSMMDSDRDFGLIERRKKQIQYVYTHEGWMDVIKSARVRRPFVVIEMLASDFKDFSNLESMCKRPKKLSDGSPIQIRKITTINVQRHLPGILYFKYNYNAAVGTFTSVDIKKKNTSAIIVSNKYPMGRAIKSAKKADLQKLLKYIPPIHHQYFTQILMLEDGQDNRPDFLVGEDLSDEEDW